MATKTISTRIKNKYDELANWQKDGVSLLPGEIAFVKVTTQQIDATTGNVVNVPAVLMKVGEEGKTFSQLPWLSAKASDVYDWAKSSTLEGVSVTIDGTADTIGNRLKQVNTNASNITTVTNAVNTLNGADTVSGSVANKIKTVIAGLANSDTAVDKQFVTVVKQTNGEVSVTRRSLTADDIPSLAASKITTGNATYATLDKMLEYINSSIADVSGSILDSLSVNQTGSGVVTSIAQDSTDKGKLNVTRSTVGTSAIADNAVTTAKINNGAVTNDKIASGVSSDKISVSDKTLTAKISDMDASIAANAEAAAHDHPYLSNTVKYAGASTAGGAATSANKVNSALSIQLNGGTATTFDGSAEKSINITPAAIGAATSSDLTALTTRVGTAEGNIADLSADLADHDHDDVYIKPADVDTKINTALGSVLKYKGTKTTTSALPTSGNATGDVWNITNACAASGNLPAVNAGDNVAWNGSAWDVLAGTVDLSSYYNKSEVDAAIAGKTYTITANAEDDDVVVLTGTSGANSVKYKATHADSGVAAGEYTKVTVNAKGHVTSASKPTEIANLGITNVYTKTEVDAGLAEKAASSHVHGNINNDGTITSQAVTAATGVLVYDSTGKIQRATAAQTRAIIGAGTSSLTLAGSGSATTAAKSDHTHSGYEGQISALEGKLTDVSSTVGASITSAINGLTHTGTASSGKFVSAVTQSAGKVSVTYSSLPTASTSAAGIVQLGTTASTAAAGNHTHSGYESKFSNIESNYVRFNSTDSKLYIGESTTDTIIFDCGGAE